jgi:hypothetical protein
VKITAGAGKRAYYFGLLGKNFVRRNIDSFPATVQPEKFILK